MNLSFDDHPELFSMIFRRVGPTQSRQSLRDLIEESQAFILRYFMMLPQIDYTIARLYYVEKLSQDQISEILNITQAAVSRRLKFILVRVKFLLKMPTLDPIQVRQDFLALFPEELFEFAFFFYWECAQNRVKYFIKTSQSGAANKFTRVMNYLEHLAALDETLLEENDPRHQQKMLALIYVEYFRYTRSKSNIITYLYKKADHLRSKALINGPSIFDVDCEPLAA